MTERVKWSVRPTILPVYSFDERSSPFQHSPTLCSLHLLDLIAKLWLSRVVTTYFPPRGGQSSAPGQSFPSFLRSLPQYQPWLLWIVPPVTTVGYYTLSATVQTPQQWFPRLCAVVQKTMLLNHFHDLQAEMVHAILYLVQIICSYSPLYHMSSALRMSAIRKHINIFYQQITSNTVTPNLSSAYIKLLGEIEIQKWNFLTNWGQQL